ncbi:MAG: DEAD/DEAH box helicase [Acidimicrobiales bacterium]
MALTTSTLDDVIGRLADDGRLVHVEHLPARPARHGRPETPVDPALLARAGVDELWSHQAEAVDLLRAGTSVVVATGTASGKSLCYQIPVAEAVGADDPGTALAIYPTKALAQDQLRSFARILPSRSVVATYDGDTAGEQRGWLRTNADVVLTNPEMLHSSILPNHPRWGRFLARLRYVIVDELHVLRGVFGTHTAHVLRRLARICALHGTEPTFAFTSATIGEPARLAADLCGNAVTSVDGDGSPRGPRMFALLDPPVLDPASGVRSSANSETGAAVADLVDAGHRTIAFCRSRKGTELVAADIRRRIPGRADEVRSYRSGYLAEERRAIEDELAAGTVSAVVATSALELGVDIGGLDACVLNGFPGTIAAMWQQAGRAGRSSGESIAVLVAGEDQLDRWLVEHPHEVFSRPPEPAVVNLANPFVLDPHLACAAFEAPLSHDDERWWPGMLDDGVRRLVCDDQLRTRRRAAGPFAVWTGHGRPGTNLSLRSGSAGEVRIVTSDGTLIGTVDEARSHTSVHDGAIYLHRGATYRVQTLDLDGREAVVEPCDGDEYTQARSDTTIVVTGTESTRRAGRAELCLGSVEVRTHVTGYQRREVRSRRILGNHVLDLPLQRLATRAFWYTVDDDLVEAAGLGDGALGGTLHAIEHAAIGILPLFTICDRWDVGGVSIALHPDTGLPTIFVYDGYPGGAGIAELGYEAADRHLAAARDVIAACGCDDGCPSCVQSPKCGNGNDPLDKAGALALLARILD